MNSSVCCLTRAATPALLAPPVPTGQAGAVAAPIFQEVMSYALHHYNIPSNGTYQKPLKGSGASISSDVT